MKTVRCAIYTRKSSEEGLEQGFNSLHAQREACAAYVLSQASEGWALLPDVYDDGGLSGGTLERPALQRLLGDVETGKIDVIVVYKVDRLTRSLLDFAKLVEALDRAGTSFISITQSFNTTNSMGRLTLNMLLSFAQFEREVTAERIRDKVAASKAKGMWMGGMPPLGYRPAGRTLTVVEEHAHIVRRIFADYHQSSNVRSVTEALRADGIMSPVRKTTRGRKYGGTPLTRGQIYTILRNPIYIGRIAHKGVLHNGQHPPIIDETLWEAVQQQLTGNVRGTRGTKPQAVASSVLAGHIVDAADCPLVASHACKGGRRYRYYISKACDSGSMSVKTTGAAIGTQSTRPEREPIPVATRLRIPASEVEQLVAREIASLLDDPLILVERAKLVVAPANIAPLMARCRAMAQDLREERWTFLPQLIDKVRIHDAKIEISVTVTALAETLDLCLDENAPESLMITRDARLTRTGRAVRLVHDNGAAATDDGVDLTLVRLIARAREWWERMADGTLDPSTLARQEGVSVSYIVRVLRLAFLSPTVVEAVLDGKLRAGIDSNALLNIRAIDPDWEVQERRCMLRT